MANAASSASASSPGAGPSSSSSASSPSPPATLPEELVEDILLRFSPTEPASLLRAALVCKPWCRLISGHRFRRRFRELHRTPPMLGFLCNTGYEGCRFVPTTAFCPPGAGRFDWEARDARHGRVLGRRYVPEEEGISLVVWDPITDEQRRLPSPPRLVVLSFAAAVLCARTATGACDHLDCHDGPFLVVFVGLRNLFELFACTYSSDVNTWSEPISTEHPFRVYGDFTDVENHPVLVGNALYFRIWFTNLNLKYNLESCEMSLIQLPSTYNWSYGHHCMLTTTEEGLLGLITVDHYKLCMWLMEDTPEVDAGWTQSRVIDLKALLPHEGVFTSPRLVAVTDGLGTLFMMVESVVYTIDLKTCKVELFQYQDIIRIKYVVPYMSFYTPELEAACAGEGPSGVAVSYWRLLEKLKVFMRRGSGAMLTG